MRLGELLDEERHRSFVGRRRELDGFDDAVAGRSSHRVLLVHGPGGIGKTTLLFELRARARAAGRNVVLLDGREVDASPEGFRIVSWITSLAPERPLRGVLPVSSWNLRPNLRCSAGSDR